MGDLEGLKRQRSVLKGVLTKLSKFTSAIKDNSDVSVEELRLKAARAKELLDKIEAVEAAIFAIDSEVESKMDEAEEAYYSIVVKLNEWIRIRSIGETSGGNNDTVLNGSTINTSPEVRLAKLQIPTFSGDYTEWQSFFDLLHSSIHSRENITPVQKFQYLMGLLRGDAFSLVKHFKVTESNYIEALKKLKQRYDRKRHSVNAFIRHFLDQPNVHTASASNVRKLLDTSDKVVRGLKALGEQAEARDPWIIYLLLRKLDDETRSLWAQENTENEFPVINDFFDFLVKRTDALESVKAHSSRQSKPSAPFKSRNSFTTTTTEVKCIAYNKEQHRLIDCARFREQSVEERRNLIGSSKRCFNCLNPGHTVSVYRIRGRCRQCSYKHHTLLHVDMQSKVVVTTKEDADTNHEDTTLNLHTLNRSHEDVTIALKTSVQTVLPTAVINVFDNLGTPRSCRALVDTASQASFITESLMQKLGLPRKNYRSLIAGIGEISSEKSRGITSLRLTSRFNSIEVASIDAIIIRKISSTLPAFEVDLACLSNLSNINLADPNFQNPGNIDILPGADIVFELLKDGNIRIGNTNLRAQNTKLGWIIGGTHDADKAITTHSFATIVDIDTTLQRFWAIEEVPETIPMTKQEEDCENWFKATTKRAPDGRFITRLPFKEMPKTLGSTYQQAVSRLLAMERRFKRDDKFHKLYTGFLEEYQRLSHMHPIELSNVELQDSYILPHHGVLKDNSSTTKLRVVFDASARSTNGLSLNQNLMIGPNEQSSLFQILTRFRQHPFVLVGDIEKMYRQVWVDQEDTRHQIILWRDQQQKICPYALDTVTYGTASASYMATRCLKELGQLHRENFPDASRAVEEDIYVDDLMTGAPILAKLIKLKDEVIQILKSGGFNLRKLLSNDPQLRAMLNDDDSTNLRIFSEHPESVKVLGIAWNANTDHLIFHVNLEDKEVHTKRSFLSEASKIFDPLGLLSPITIKIKILFQSLWLQKIGWDEPLPSETRLSWMELRKSLCQIPEIKIPRCITIANSITIHGFCNASKWAYSAAIYARSQGEHGYSTHLICAKTKVAPLKQVSIPRLELMGAVLLNRLVKEVTAILSINISSVTMWTDSKIVLDWLSSPPRRWTTFVANRVSEIIGGYKRDKWRHVPSRQNPADCATRGKSTAEMIESELWWNGPEWLSKEEQLWPDQPHIPETKEDMQVEVYNTTCLTIDINHQDDIILRLSQKHNSYFKLIKIFSYVRRFLTNLKAKKNAGKRQNGVLTVAEMEMANREVVIYWQSTHFPEEYRNLQINRAIPVKSTLKQLNPFMDSEGVMRVGGRLERSALPYSTKHPIILSSKSPIATAITLDVHQQRQHPGTQLLMSLVRQNYWVVRGKDVAKKVFRQCIKCARQNPKLMTQLMGQLPEHRVRHTAPFGAVGVDFCGPFKVHAIRRRGSTPAKAYLCIFVCFSTHAIHIEICMNLNLSSESFLGALRRFISRRGLCHTIYCDNATNFVGARNKVDEVYTFLKNNNENIQVSLLKDKITWRFIPPAAPHQGGLWESAVKSTKTQITRTIGDSILTLEEFSTLTAQIEGVLNSRPICSSNDDDLDFLTPAHFLIGRPIHQLPEAAAEQKLNPNARWDIVKHIFCQFWKRWQLEYLTSLQPRYKWLTQKKNLQLNDVVLIHENNLPPTQWLMGRVIKLFPGNDGNVRVAEIKTKNGTLKRPIQKLCKLPSLESEDDSTRGVWSNPLTPVQSPENK